MLKTIKLLVLIIILLILIGYPNKTKLFNKNSYKTIVADEKTQQTLKDITDKYTTQSDIKNRYEIILPEYGIEMVETNKVSTGSICVETKVFANGSEGGVIKETYKNKVLQHINITSFGSMGKNISDYYFKEECVMITYIEIYYKEAISIDKLNEIDKCIKKDFLYDDAKLYVYDENTKGYSIIDDNSYDFLISRLQKVE